MLQLLRFELCTCDHSYIIYKLTFVVQRSRGNCRLTVIVDCARLRWCQCQFADICKPADDVSRTCQLSWSLVLRHRWLTSYVTWRHQVRGVRGTRWSSARRQPATNLFWRRALLCTSVKYVFRQRHGHHFSLGGQKLSKDWEAEVVERGDEWGAWGCNLRLTR